MPAYRLLDIDPDKLFVENSINEIKTIQKKLQAENERKRVELRTIVGERYRDLIEAADTISDMKVTAEGVIGHIEEISAKCQELQHQHLIGFKLDPKESTSNIVTNKTQYAMAAQIKILIDMPEQIWCAVEEEDYLLGAQLFLFARHINTGLELHTRTDNAASSMAQWFPILHRQWSSIRQFQDIILSRCHSKLKTHDLSNKEASSCLSTLVLLQGLGSVELLAAFLDLRVTALKLVLESEQLAGGGGVRSRVCSSLLLLMHTVSLLHACFVGPCEAEGSTTEGLVWRQLKNITGRDAPPTLALLDLQHSGAANFLPTVIQDFRPSTSERVDPVPPGHMRQKVTAWLSFVERFIREQVSSRLRAVATVKGLQAIREEAAGLTCPTEHWDQVCQRLMMPRNLRLWDGFYRPLVTDRVKEIVKHNWGSILDQLLVTFAQAMQELGAEKSSRDHQPESDLRWFVWSEWSTDLPQGGVGGRGAALGLSMKTRGYSPRLEKLCSDLDRQLLALLTDLQHYVGADGKTALGAAPEQDKMADASVIQEHLRACTMDNCMRLLEFVRSECTKHGESCSILLARFLHGLLDLCPNLQRCLASGASSGASSGAASGVGNWQQLMALLRAESLATWEVWGADVSTRLQALVRRHLRHQQELCDQLHCVPQYESAVSLDEEGGGATSDMLVPSQPSLPLQSLLHAASHNLNAAVPHTLPTTVHRQLIERLVQDIFAQYAVLVNAGTVTQAQGLQMALDVKYVTMLLVPRDNKALMGTSQELSDQMDDKVDPFDLDVFTPYIQSNIKRSVQRTQCLLGVLIAWPEKMAPQRTSSKHSTAEDPNVLPLSTSAPWIPLLPVTGGPRAAPSTLLATPSSAQRKKATSPKPKVDSSPGEMVRSGAAAFFGDWFTS